MGRHIAPTWPAHWRPLAPKRAVFRLSQPICMDPSKEQGSFCDPQRPGNPQYPRYRQGTLNIRGTLRIPSVSRYPSWCWLPTPGLVCAAILPNDGPSLTQGPWGSLGVAQTSHLCSQTMLAFKTAESSPETDQGYAESGAGIPAIVRGAWVSMNASLRT